MKTIIHNIVRFWVNLFMPFIYLAFLLAAGTGCALVSALIEYDVIAGLFPKSYEIIPLLIVAAAEISKVFLVFLGKQLDENYTVNEKILMGALRFALISLSFTATLLFSFYNLHNPEYDAQLEKGTERLDRSHQEKIAEVSQRYEGLIAGAEQSCEKERQRIAQQYQPEIDHWQAEMKKEERYRDSQGSFEGKRYKTYQKNFKEAKQQRDKAISEINCETTMLIDKQQAEIDKLSSLKESQITDLKDNLHGSMVSGNQMVVAALKVFFNVRSESEYPQRYYIIAIIALSLLVSVCLESIIWASFTVLSVNHGAAYSSWFKNRAIEEELKADYEHQHQMEKLKSQNIKDMILSKYNTIKDMLDRLGRA